jgi:CBS-domain-containing membrane protein
MELIGVQRFHRLIVVDETGRLVGIITLSDILKYLVRDNMGFFSTHLLPSVESPAEAEHAL